MNPFAELSDGVTDYTISPVYHFSYSRLILPHLILGIAIAYEHQYSEVYSVIPGFSGKHYVYKADYFTGLLYAHYYWLQRCIFGFYSGMGLGSNFLVQNDEQNDFIHGGTRGSQFVFAYQMTPFGVRIGKRLAGYAELGYGYKGFVVCGISYRF